MKLDVTFKNLWARVKNNKAAFLWAALIIVFIFDGFVVKRSISIINSAKNTAPPPINKSVRINFSLYDKVLTKLQGQQTYEFSITPNNPFGLAPTKK